MKKIYFFLVLTFWCIEYRAMDEDPTSRVKIEEEAVPLENKSARASGKSKAEEAPSFNINLKPACADLTYIQSLIHALPPELTEQEIADAIRISEAERRAAQMRISTLGRIYSGYLHGVESLAAQQVVERLGQPVDRFVKFVCDAAQCSDVKERRKSEDRVKSSALNFQQFKSGIEKLQKEELKRLQQTGSVLGELEMRIPQVVAKQQVYGPSDKYTKEEFASYVTKLQNEGLSEEELYEKLKQDGALKPQEVNIKDSLKELFEKEKLDHIQKLFGFLASQKKTEFVLKNAEKQHKAIILEHRKNHSRDENSLKENAIAVGKITAGGVAVVGAGYGLLKVVEHFTSSKSDS